LTDGDRAAGTVSIAGPTVRMTEKRVREIAPFVVACAAEMATLWPLRPRARKNATLGGIPRAA